MRRKFLIAMALVGLSAAGVGLNRASANPDLPGGRDLRLLSGNPDGTFKCQKWCGVTELCC